jgi:hypothetical protein
MTGGDRVSARERGRTREQAARMGRAAGPRGCERAQAGVGANGPLGWAEPEGERRRRPELILFFFLQNVNSTNICLFH